VKDASTQKWEVRECKNITWTEWLGKLAIRKERGNRRVCFRTIYD
jgi:hypothetical protein